MVKRRLNDVVNSFVGTYKEHAWSTEITEPEFNGSGIKGIVSSLEGQKLAQVHQEDQLAEILSQWWRGYYLEHECTDQEGLGREQWWPALRK